MTKHKQINSKLSLTLCEDELAHVRAHSSKENPTFLLRQEKFAELTPNLRTQKIYLTKPMMEKLIKAYKQLSK